MVVIISFVIFARMKGEEFKITFTEDWWRNPPKIKIKNPMDDAKLIYVCVEGEEITKTYEDLAKKDKLGDGYALRITDKDNNVLREYGL